MSGQLRSPPQDDRVRLTYTAKEDAGRYAVAQRAISPGELVLTAAPYGLVMNPKFCPSALYLSARCTSSGSSSGAAAAASGDAAETPKNTRGGKVPQKKNASRHGAKSETVTDAGAAYAAPYKDALYGDGSQRNGSGAPATAPLLRWYTTQSTWCAVCFQQIPAGRWMCNRGSLAELAVDVSEEQEEMGRQLHLAAAQTATKYQEEGEGEGAAAAVLGDAAADEEEFDVHHAAAAAAALRKLKKPTKSARTRKDGAVELKQKLLEKALAQREEIFYERRLQRRARTEHGCPAVRLEGWAARKQGDGSADASTSLFAGAMSGCSGCGVLCYCSEYCWRAHHAQHVESGECAVLRGLYPRLMSEYYSTGVGAGRGAGLSTVTVSGTVLLPGDEPLHWARSSSEQKMLEFQSLLFSAVMLTRACRDGYAAHLKGGDSTGDVEDSTVDATVATETTEAAMSVDASSPAAALQPAGNRSVPDCGAAVDADALPSTSPLPSVSNTVDSVVVPKEVLTILDVRRRAGLTGMVEVLDSDPALRQHATDGDAHSAPMECVTYIDTVETGSNDVTLPSLDGVGRTPFTSELYVRRPRYADMAQMETNLSVISKTRRSNYQRYYRVFTKRVLPVLQLLNLDTSPKARSEDDFPTTTTITADVTRRLCVSEAYFVRLCAAVQCNSFGIYDTDDSCIAFGVYPEASYFNHSCVPNICRVMHHGGRVMAFYALRSIAAGAPLTISYTDVEQQNSAERRRNLLETYRFFCTCERCSGHAEGPTMAVARSTGCHTTHSNNGSTDITSSGALKNHGVPVVAVPSSLFEKPLLLCTRCAIRGYLRPFRPTRSADAAAREAATWSMAEVVGRECTVCHCRVVREPVKAT
ncbi:hypothetical protein ABB37_02116 [Leptomonas pyrrhocoris]|uniref:SET domain-containing protein n=1 Tax=Leptomonas pyrrhocoris TaxID=157538 RepID=A0A0N0DYC8_LEPPY|nr:hypothetical protein ABB37_02116 [Leptomonas pyrrhocoris]KPA83972.1 hypothetical protein ABB37_02116 [Leptomonas pyrrhocoris]|eukprot:XP_015662411.1 hypothetical protein ABB37_02116 [Leptomonas pyrrhocoris]